MQTNYAFCSNISSLNSTGYSQVLVGMLLEVEKADLDCKVFRQQRHSLGMPSFSINSYRVGRLMPSSAAAVVILPPCRLRVS